MDPITLAMLLGAYLAGKHLKSDAPAAAPQAPPAGPSGLAPPPSFTAAQIAGLVEDGAFRAPIQKAIAKRLEVCSLLPIQGPPGVLFFRLVPLGRASALQQIESALSAGTSVFVSLSTLLPTGEKLVAMADSLRESMLVNSPHFARFLPEVPEASEAPAPSPEPVKLNGIAKNHVQETAPKAPEATEGA